MTKVFVGLNVSKDKLDIAPFPKGEFFQVKNDGEGLMTLAERLSSLPIASIVTELSSGYEGLA